MTTIVGNKKGWFERHEEKQAAADVTEFLEILSAASDGDYQCRHLMQLDLNLNLSFNKMKDVPKATRLSLLYKTALELCLVGIKMDDELLQNMNACILEYLEWFQKESLPGEDQLCSRSFDPQMICTSLQTEVKDMKAFHEFVAEKNRRRRIQVNDDLCADIEDELYDPSYVPCTPSGSESEEVESVPKVADKKRKEQDHPNPRKVKLPKLDAVRSLSPEIEHQQKRKEKNADQKGKKRSHHRREECPICKKEIYDILRHLRKHAEKGDIGEDDVMRIASVAKKKSRRRGTSRVGKEGARPGLKYKWCPYEGCQVVTHLLRSHLQHKHRVKTGTLLDQYVRVAKDYRGKVEAEHIQSLLHVQRESVRRSTCTVTTSCDSLSQRPSTPAESEDCAASTSAEPAAEAEAELSDSKADSEESDEEFTHQKDYFTCTNPITKRHKWLTAFYQHLNLPAAGRKKDRNRLQHERHIKTMLEDLDPRGTDIEILSQNEGYIVWTHWVDVKMNSLRTGTIKAYLGTFEKFLTFVVEERVRSTMPQVSTDAKRVFRNVIPKLKGWRKTVDIDMRPQRTQRILDECENRLTNEDVEQFHRSKHVLKIQSLFENVSDGHRLTEREICEARDYLLTMITLRTGTRPGALEHAKMADYHRMKKDQKRGHYVMLVAQHKRQVDGPAVISFTKELKEMLDVYVEKIRQHFPKPNDENLFLNNSGKAFAGAKISTRVPEFWQKTEVRPDIQVTATNIRKWIVTVCHQKKCEGANFDESVLRRAMCHSDRVAQSNYLRHDLTAVGAEANDIIAMCTNQTPVSSKQTALEEDALNIQEPQEDPGNVQSDNEKDSNTRPLTAMEKEEIKSLFQQEIVDNVLIVLKDVRPKLSTSLTLRKLMPYKEMVRRVADCVRYFQTKEPRKEPEELPESGKPSLTSTWVASSTETLSSQKCAWSNEDAAIIKKYFVTPKKAISIHEVRKMFQEIEELRNLLKEKRLQQCVDKIKNMRKEKGK